MKRPVGDLLPITIRSAIFDPSKDGPHFWPAPASVAAKSRYMYQIGPGIPGMGAYTPRE
jgi:hypothetical protein